jgi:hypothetical protein
VGITRHVLGFSQLIESQQKVVSVLYSMEGGESPVQRSKSIPVPLSPRKKGKDGKKTKDDLPISKSADGPSN